MKAEQIERAAHEKSIAIYDSGCGGVNFLKKALVGLPQENFVYFGDIAYAPYGSRERQYIIERGLAVTEFLLTKNIKTLVVACNTATGMAISAMRARYPDLMILGMEPAIAPACKWVQQQAAAQVVVLGTEGTMKSANMLRLIDLHREEAEIISVPCPGLMDLVEFNGTAAQLDAYCAQHLDGYLLDRSQAVVLGCTHYIFLREYFSKRYAKCAFFDGDSGTLAHLQRQLARHNLANAAGNNSLEIYCSGDNQKEFRAKVENYLK